VVLLCQLVGGFTRPGETVDERVVSEMETPVHSGQEEPDSVMSLLIWDIHSFLRWLIEDCNEVL
jgi:hypothetical protein